MGKLVAATPSEPQGECPRGSAERSGERNREPTNRNRIGGGADQGERASDREALATKGRRRRSGGCAGKVTTLTWGDLASCLKGRRRKAEREVSRGRSSAGHRPIEAATGSAKGRTRGRAKRPWVSEGKSARSPRKRNYRGRAGVKPRGYSGAAKPRGRRKETSAQEPTI